MNKDVMIKSLSRLIAREKKSGQFLIETGLMARNIADAFSMPLYEVMNVASKEAGL